MKTIRWDENLVRLQLWDIAGTLKMMKQAYTDNLLLGQERFGVMTRVYYKESSGAVVVFDISKANKLDGVVRWKKDLDAKCRLRNGRSIPTIALANKCDLEKYCSFHDKSGMDDFCVKYGFVGWFETSAKENVGIDEAMKHLVNHMITIQAAGDFEIPVLEDDQKAIRLTSFPSTPDSHRKCCRI
ncbi:unnamed protein product [Soboliphyme baturini]|uniref:Ras-related protein Rab n=1 Tax=Soboliphyme baturini TaxID=241478 RepID=A0A183IXJ8_9BILA|nr:unnamed protein product [Soboliphyme baturini]